jgi:predicted transposase YdaD
LRFFYVGADEIFDMDRGFEFLDKELGQLYPGQDIMHPKFVDKLVKVYRKDGKEEWLLIHIEVQGYHDPQFARRMFTYFYRILDRLDKEVASIAIFIDNDRNYQPDSYEYSSLETSTIFRFKTYKVKGQNTAILENSDNPFAVVVLTVLIALQKAEKSPEDLLDLSLDLSKRLFRKGFSKKKINSLLEFIRSYVFLDNKEMFFKFEEGIDNINSKKRNMGVRELVTLLLKEEGKEEKEVSVITNLLQKTNHSIQEIAELVDVPVDSVIEVQNKLTAAAQAN